MKKIIAIAAAAVLCGTAANAGKFDNYLALKAGYNFGGSDDLYDDMSGLGARLSFGQNYRSRSWLYFRTEAEFNYSRLAHNKVSASPMGLLLNFFVDFGTKEWLIKPYVGAGFGGEYISIDAKGRNLDSSAGMAWDVQGGVTMNLSDEMKLDLSLRYDGIAAIDYNFHSTGVYAGVRWNF